MAKVDITVTNDADFYRLFQYVTTGLVPINITGCSLEMKVRRRAEDHAALLRLGTDTGEIVLTDPTNGFFTVMIVKDELLRLGLGAFAHSNVMTFHGVLTSIWSGSLTVNAGAAR